MSYVRLTLGRFGLTLASLPLRRGQHLCIRRLEKAAAQWQATNYGEGSPQYGLAVSPISNLVSVETLPRITDQVFP
jgi:hypothetical protein